MARIIARWTAKGLVGRVGRHRCPNGEAGRHVEMAEVQPESHSGKAESRETSAFGFPEDVYLDTNACTARAGPFSHGFQ